jgi:O-antigen biosynthesis protein
MEHYTHDGIRGLVPEAVKSGYRLLREWWLSRGLGGAYSLGLSEEERQASSNMSVVVAVHDAPEVTHRCLNSLERFGGDSEVIVVDDGSKQEATKRMLKTVCLRNEWRLITHGQALGHSGASQAGMALARRPYGCLLNSDTVISPRSWWGVAQAFSTSSQIGVVGPSTSCTAGPQVVSRALYCRHSWSDDQVWWFAEKYAVCHRKDTLVEMPAVGGFAFFVRREVWHQLGGFDKNLTDYGNESEFCQRLLKAGFRIVWTKASYIHHLGSESYGRTLGFAEIRKRAVGATAYIEKKFSQ